MARISYPDLSGVEGEPLAARIKRERGGKILNLYKMLLHSPPLADGWRALLTAVRQQAELPGRYRELVILRVAALNGAEYEYDVHVPFALREGLAQATIDALREDCERPDLDDVERAVLEYTDAMTRDVHVPDGVFARVREHFTERQIVELTATIAAYNCVSRFLEALRIDHE